MGVKVIIAPAGSGKTAWVVERSQRQSSQLMDTPRVVVPSRIQAVTFRQRIAQQGGAIGVQVGTFEDLSQDVLNLAGIHKTKIKETAQGRLLQTVFETCGLKFYSGIKDLPGFTQVIQKILNELKSGGIQPNQFAAAVKGMGGNQRIEEISRIYSAYQSMFVKEEWLDYIGEIWLAAEILENTPGLCSSWKTLFVDGFDDLSPVQLRVILALEKQIPDIYITLTGTKSGFERPLVHKRFLRTLSLLRASTDPEIITLEELGNKEIQTNLISNIERLLFQVKENKLI
ncbi:MAG: UvrD-helicase domain-containing protein, partial [Anaerolineales bacterium]|nr:UvrD-helicase domain-containing protein [Anaerolineales bacterium]